LPEFSAVPHLCRTERRKRFHGFAGSRGGRVPRKKIFGPEYEHAAVMTAFAVPDAEKPVATRVQRDRVDTLKKL
jgi:hypothetical protein